MGIERRGGAAPWLVDDNRSVLRGAQRPAIRESPAKCAWYRREDYPVVLAMLVDSEKMSPTYAEWLLGARRLERQAAEAGRPLARIYIHPKVFELWCNRRYRRPSTLALKEFVRTSAMKLDDSLG